MFGRRCVAWTATTTETGPRRRRWVLGGNFVVWAKVWGKTCNQDREWAKKNQVDGAACCTRGVQQLCAARAARKTKCVSRSLDILSG